jgi:hypothetical protein
MRLATILTVHAAAAAAFVGARRLMRTPVSDLERLPVSVRAPLLATRGRLLRGRERAREAIATGREAKREAEVELTAEYHRRAGRRP